MQEVESVRLKIRLKVDKLNLPISYKHILQGVIYDMLRHDDQGIFYHDKGYQLEDKVFKMFVFSDLLGKYEIKGDRIVFDDQVVFYVSSMDNDFAQQIYTFLENNDAVYMLKQKAGIVSFDVQQIKPFRGVKEITLKTISPITAYTTKDKKVTYFYPGSPEFEKSLRDNIEHKFTAYEYPAQNVEFNITGIEYSKKLIVKYKDTLYAAYKCEFKVLTNYDCLRIMYETGAGSKNSCGFGMIEIRNEKDNISV